MSGLSKAVLLLAGVSTAHGFAPSSMHAPGASTLVRARPGASVCTRAGAVSGLGMESTRRDGGALMGLRMRTAGGDAAPLGTDPFSVVKDDMAMLKAKLKKMAKVNLQESEDAQAMMAKAGAQSAGSGLGFQAKNLIDRPEKSWRPVVVILLAQMLGEGKDGLKLGKSEYLAMAEIVEIMHMSTMIHDTVLEDGDRLDKGNAAHKMYSSNIAGNKVSILAGDALLSRASVLSASLRNNEVVELVAGALESLMVGQMQLHRPTRDSPPLNAYMQNVVLRAGDLVSKGCESVAILAGYDADHPRVAAAREYGLNLAIAYQVLTDLRVTEANYAKLLNKIANEGKSAEGVRFEADEINEALSRAGPLLYASVIFPELEEMAVKGFGSVEEVLHARSLIERCDGVEGIRRLAQYHAGLALEALDAFGLEGGSEADSALRTLVAYVLEDGQERLLRKNYKDEVFIGGVGAGSEADRADSKAKQELYTRLDRLYGKAWEGVKNLVMSSMRGVKDRANYDIGQLHRGLVRDAVLLYGKNVDVESVHEYIHAQCAFRASAREVEAMMMTEVKWQIEHGIETAEDLEAMRDMGNGSLMLEPVPQRIAYDDGR